MYLHPNRFGFDGETMDWMRYHPKGRVKVLLREPEACAECGKIYLSLYPLRNCSEHEGLDAV